MIQSFDFYNFLKDITNQSIVPLQGNDRYDDLLRGIANTFDTLYKRVQEIKIENTLELNNDIEYQNNLNTNQGTVNQDIILEYLSMYLDTDHFKDTVALLMRIYEYRSNGNDWGNIDKFVEKWIVPSFKFFTMNAGDLHKWKGTSGLLERLFEFYSEVNDNTVMFDGIIEEEDEDKNDWRLNKFTSPRIGIDEVNLKRNYPNISAIDNINITKYVELNKHKYVVAGSFLFMSEKDRDDWWIIDILDNFYKLNDDYFVVLRSDDIYLYSDNVNIYNTNYEFVAPVWTERETNVEFVPQVMNNSDKFNEYHNNNFYWIEKIDNEDDTLADYYYNLKRWHMLSDGAVSLQMVKEGLGIGYEPLAFETNQSSYPRITDIVNVDYIWLDFHEDNATTYDFRIQDVKMVYTFTYDYQFEKVDGTSTTYPMERLIAVARDGYDYDHDANGFYYQIISKLEDGSNQKYSFVHRVLSSQFDQELYKLLGSETVDIRSVFDIFIVQKSDTTYDDYFTAKGYWNANNDTYSPPSTNPSHGDYWIVSQDGNVELNGIKYWQANDIVVWNGNFGYWEKNNQIPSIKDQTLSYYKLDHTIVALGTPQFDTPYSNPDNTIKSEYEKSGGMYLMKCSDVDVNVSNYSNVLSVDVNAIETFGDNSSLLYLYVDKNDSRFKVYSVKTFGFYDEHDRMDLSRVLKNFPLNTSIISIYKLEVTDKHIVVYCRDTRNTQWKTMVLVLENTQYNLPLELQTNDFNMSYDVDVRTRTRNNQPWYRINDENGDEVEDEEVAAFESILDRYSPITSQHDSIKGLMDLGFSNQKYDNSYPPENYPVVFPALDTTKYAKEQVYLKPQDSLFLRVDGDPDDVNCDCENQRKTLYVYDFEPMILFYDLDTGTGDPDVYGYPTKVALQKVGVVSDEYSGYETVCRFESDWFFYYYDSGETFPLYVRQKIRLNLYSSYQSFLPYCGKSELRFNWGMHHYIEYHDEREETTIEDWIVGLDEEIYKPVSEDDECNPVGTFYTTNVVDDGNTIGCDGSLQNPWTLYNIEAAKISLT
jgi:hypothetical protein